MAVQDEFFKEYYRDFLGKSRYNLSHSLDTSARIGQVFPVLLEEMIPGDHIHCRISQITNFLPLIHPVQGVMQVRFETFFAPAQLLMNRDRWEKFISNPLSLNDTETVDKVDINAKWFNDMPFEGFDIINRIAPCFPTYNTEIITSGSTGYSLPTNNFLLEDCYSWQDVHDKCFTDATKIDGIDKSQFTLFPVFEDDVNPLFGLSAMGVNSHNATDFPNLSYFNYNVIQSRFTKTDLSNFSVFDYLGVNHDSLRIRSIRENIENFVNDCKKHNDPVPSICVRALYDLDEHNYEGDYSSKLVPINSIYSVLDSTENLYKYLDCINIVGFQQKDVRYHVDFTNLMVLLGRLHFLSFYLDYHDLNLFEILSGDNWKSMTDDQYRILWTFISPRTNYFALYSTLEYQGRTVYPTISTLFDLNPGEDSIWRGVGDYFASEFQLTDTARFAMKTTIERLLLLAIGLRGYTGVYTPLWLAAASWHLNMSGICGYSWIDDEFLVYDPFASQWDAGNYDRYHSAFVIYSTLMNTVITEANNTNILSLPLRLYPRVYNDWYRIPDIDEERKIADGYETNGEYSDYSLFSRAYARDKFVTAFTNPTAKIITVGAVNVDSLLNKINIEADGSLSVKGRNSGIESPVYSVNSSITNRTLNMNSNYDGNEHVEYLGGIKLVSSDVGTQIGGFSIEELRVAVRLQNMADYLNKFSGDYVDYMRSVFTTVPSDASLRRSTIVHSYSDYVAVGDVVTQTNAERDQTPGERFGIAKSMGQSPDFDYSTKEHGYLITLCSVEPFVGYNQGLSPLWKRFDALDFYTPNMCTPQLIPIRREELLHELFNENRGSSNRDVFGYNEKDLDYKVHFNRSSADVRNKLRTYSLTRDLNSSLDHIGAAFQRIDSRDYDYLFNMTNKLYNSQFVMNIYFSIDKDSIVDEDVDPTQGTGLL